MEGASITLVSYKQWFIPADTKSYVLLCQIGIASTQIHEDMIGVVKMQCQKRHIALRGKKFGKVMTEFTETLENFWNKQHRVCALNPGHWIFRANKTAYDLAKKKSAELIERKIRQFFDRWGIDGEFTFSENEGSSLKLVVSFKKRNRIPTIPLKTVVTEERALTLGNQRLVITQDRTFMYLSLYTKQGIVWSEKPVWQHRALHKEVTNPGQFIGALLDSYNRE